MFDIVLDLLIGGMDKRENRLRKENKVTAWSIGMLLLDVLIVAHLIISVYV